MGKIAPKTCQKNSTSLPKCRRNGHHLEANSWSILAPTWSPPWRHLGSKLTKWRAQDVPRAPQDHTKMCQHRAKKIQVATRAPQVRLKHDFQRSLGGFLLCFYYALLAQEGESSVFQSFRQVKKTLYVTLNHVVVFQIW